MERIFISTAVFSLLFLFLPYSYFAISFIFLSLVIPVMQFRNSKIQNSLQNLPFGVAIYLITVTIQIIIYLLDILSDSFLVQSIKKRKQEQVRTEWQTTWISIIFLSGLCFR